MSRLNFLMAITLFGAFAIPRTEAATVTYTLELNDNGAGVYTPRSFAVYADDSTSDNGGLMLYSVDITAFNSVANVGPRTIFDADGSMTTTSPSGFTAFRSNDNVSPISGQQDITGSTNTFIYGFGQTADSFANHDPYPQGVLDSPTTQSAWSAHLLLATGTFLEGQTPAFTSSPTPSIASVWNAGSGLGNSPATVAFSMGSLSASPEPGCVGTFGIVITYMLSGRRRRSNEDKSAINVKNV
ncbi:MAG TPA: hypothetical protein VFC46_11485 [Humisphaera sp.]|nr:hypothetical protein [Humisphaera sp.]